MLIRPADQIGQPVRHAPRGKIVAFQFITYDQINWGGLGAAATLITLPPLVLTLFIQKYIIRGFTHGAVKE